MAVEVPGEIAMADVPSSPPAAVTVTAESVPALPSRKRTRHQPSARFNLTSSDDAPLFSSDDFNDASVDNYAPGRSKRQFLGPWWQHSSQTVPDDAPQPQPRGFGRNLDSGIFMGSDDTVSSEDSATSLPLPLDLRCAPRHYMSVTLSEPELRAVELIRYCLERGEERVDLSNYGIQSLSNGLLEPLHQLIKHPRHAGTDLPGPESYEVLVPALQLFLSGNSLRSIPREVWNFQSLTVLSLRNNELTELPPSIGRLHNLVELNVSGNRLRWLPWELLRLYGKNGKLRRLTTLPNPFVQGLKFTGTLQTIRQWHFPSTSDGLRDVLQSLQEDLASSTQDSAEAIQTAWLLKLHNLISAEVFREHISTSLPSEIPHLLRSIPSIRKEQPLLIAATPLSYFAFDGSPLPGFSPPSVTPENVELVPASLTLDMKQPPSHHPSSRAPSLLELTLRTLTTSSNFSNSVTLSTLRSYLPRTTSPAIIRTINLAFEVQENGGRNCSVCKRAYAIPRAEWIEYWHFVPDGAAKAASGEMFVPHLRRVCSFGCAKEGRGAEDVEVGER
ncbi:hypothetical protein K402DRAFT_455692 [Aulographum hederae CBS 113979]|uniref:L domain-like protein n=1 Tax=Aulographum hederae CBS 113979 TaxID=1176131 RepID=A0A6G1GUQ6_9PEZI|nr:hypothetical protein K402DRAFT_455692 [Aulographum hederae CBS 113979]